MFPFLLLPLDLRLLVYERVLADHQAIRQSKQPSNAHFRFLHVSRHIYHEARDSFARYVSLQNELQMERFLYYISSSPGIALSVRWADVANDGRIVETLNTGHTTPASQLYRILAKLTSLERLRVFDVRHYHPYSMSVPQLRYFVDFEGAMYPAGTHKDHPRLTSYELYLDPSTCVTVFDRLSSDHVRSMRLSGDCQLGAIGPSFAALRHLTIRGVTNNTFDRIKFNSVFAHSQLDSFTHAQGHRLGFEIRNVHLESLVDGPGRGLRKLVLLGCTRLTTLAVASCLRDLPTLEYFALSLVTVNELRDNFIVALGPSLRTLKLQIAHAWYSLPLFSEERVYCNSLEERILSPTSRLDVIYICFHERLMAEDGREERWMRIARDRHLTLKIGPWEKNEET